MRKHQYKDIVGQRFGRLVVLNYTKTIDKRPYWNCRCDCGCLVEKRGKELKSGLIKSCGCLLKNRGPDIDLTGQKFGYLTVIECVGKRKNNRLYYWLCRCDCGKVTQTVCNKLKSGHTKSCGCLHDRVAKERAIIRNKEMSGSNHPNWNPNLTEEDRQRAKEGRTNDPKLNRWRKKVYERDGYKCQKCSGDKPRLVAHHVYSWHSHTKLRYVANNGSTLCENCHKDFHKKYGLKNNTRKQYNKWKNNGYL